MSKIKKMLDKWGFLNIIELNNEVDAYATHPQIFKRVNKISVMNGYLCAWVQ